MCVSFSLIDLQSSPLYWWEHSKFVFSEGRGQRVGWSSWDHFLNSFEFSKGVLGLGVAAFASKRQKIIFDGAVGWGSVDAVSADGWNDTTGHDNRGLLDVFVKVFKDFRGNAGADSLGRSHLERLGGDDVLGVFRDWLSNGKSVGSLHFWEKVKNSEKFLFGCI